MLVLLGANHRSAPLPVRERIAIPETELRAALARIRGADGVEEAFLLSTCNRTELVVHARDAATGLAAARGFLVETRELSPEELDRHTYHFRGTDVVLHLFRVAGGLDSMILGEPQITGQVKRAYQEARAAGTTGTVIEKLLQSALATAKRVRTETGISRQPVSVAFAAVELARQIFGKLGGRAVLLLGAGKMGELVATHLASHGLGGIWVSSRTYNRAAVLAGRFGGEAVNWVEWRSMLERVDIVVSGTAAPELILDRAAVLAAMRRRRSRPLFVIDIAVPRDVDPAVNDLDNVYLYDVDDLQAVIDANLENRRREAKSAQKIVEQEAQAFERWKQSLAITPTIVALKTTLSAIGRGEVERFRRRLGPLTPQQESTVEELARAIVQKVLHRPIRHLKRSAPRRDVAEAARALREMFDLGDEPEVGQAPGPSAGDAGGGSPEAGHERERPGDASGPRRLLRGGRD